MKEFNTAAKEADPNTDSDALEFSVDGVLCRAYRPGDGQLAVLVVATSSYSTTEEGVAGVLNFFASTLDDESHTYLTSKLLDRKDPFGLGDVEGIISWLVEEWGGHPTQQPSDSASSQQTGGQNSTAPTPALI